LLHRTQSQGRTPLGTLSLSQEDESPGRPARRRLYKRDDAHPEGDEEVEGGYRSTSPSPGKRTASEKTKVTMTIAQRRERAKEAKGRSSEFVEAEAVESDEDDVFGFGDRRKNDDEDEEDDGDAKDVEGLVDDQEMSEEMIARKLIQEKAA
jgi:mediator of replication checkpoint protein 1